jgi:cellulase
VEGFYGCEGKECGDGKAGVCDGVGCGFNPYGLGKHDFYGLEGKVDTRKPFRVVTRFVTDGGTDDGELVGFRRHYVQDGKIISNAEVTLRAKQYDSITQNFCRATDATSFLHHGGLAQMGESLRRGMVLVMGIWNEGNDNLNWLDSGDAGPCGKKEGDPAVIKKEHPGTSVTFEDVRWGDIGSTC